MNYDFFENDLDSVNGLMTMTVYSVIADVLKIDLDTIELHSRLTLDLGMTEHNQKELCQVIMEMFDDLVVDISSESLVQDIVEQVLEDESEEQDYSEFA